MSVLLHEDVVVPVLDLGEKLSLRTEYQRSGLLFASAGRERFGFQVGSDRGALAGTKLLPLPPACRTPWCSSAAVADGSVIPLVDLTAVLARQHENPGLVGQYTPASDFPARFRKGSVEVLEFALRGARYALPRDEVKEIVPRQPFRTLSGTPEIVLGVAERGGRLYPVLDLAAVFGDRSRPTEAWRMLRLSNGDFQALVLAESVEDDRILEPELQRSVPIRIPHDVLYGCYLDERAVRLILNVHSLTVHFEKTGVREMVAGLAPPAGHPSAPEVPAERSAAAGPSAPVEEPAAPVTTELVEQTLAAASTAPGQASSAISDTRTRAGGEAKAREEWLRQQEDTRRLQEELARRLESERKTAEAAARKAAQEAAEKATAEQLKAEEEVRKIAEEKERDAKERARIAEERAAKERAEAEARARAEAEAKIKAEEERLRAEEEQRRAEEERRRVESERGRAEDLAAEERKRQEAFRKEEEEGSAASRIESAGQRAQPSTPTPPVRSAAAASERSYTTAIVIGILAVIAAIFLLMQKRTAPPEIRPSPAVEQAAKKEPEKKKELEPALYLNVPREMPKPETVVYVVVKGDTLWGISKRFTGNPFNYPRVARDNSIATPDLIFPGQKIRLVQEK
jgi:chemotaxis signal transduction protein/nucleoid-associated protein YgaU